MKQINPPFDGSAPCPMCNQEIRGASATLHNLLNRWPDQIGKAMVKLNDMRRFWKRPAELAVPHPVVTELMDVVDALVAAVDGMTEEGITIRWPREAVDRVEAIISRARTVNEAVHALSDAHFHDQRHSTAGENILREQRGVAMFTGAYEHTVEVVTDGGNIWHTACGTRLRLHDYFKRDLARDPAFFGKVWCPHCRANLPFAQFEILSL